MSRTNGTTTTSLTPWADGSTELTTEADNALAAEILGGFQNLATLHVASGLPFLGINKQGRWHYGQENTEVEPGSYWGVDARTTRWGYIAWVDGRPAGEVMVPLKEARPLASTLEHGLPWQEQYSVEMVCLTGQDQGLRVLYKTSSVGGVNAFVAWKEATKKQIAVEPAKPFSVVQLEVSSYQHKKYGATAYPVLHIAGWCAPGALAHVEGGGPTPPAPAPAAPAKAAPTATDARRRRVAS